MRTRLTAALLVLGLAAAGCGGGGDGAPTDKPEAAATPTATATPAPDEAITTVEYQGGRGLDTYRVRIDSLRREGPFMTLNATVACVRGEEEGDDCNTQSAFAALPSDNNTFSGVVAVDPAGQRAYRTVRASDELFSATYDSDVEPGMAPEDPPRHVWARFAAPPQDVTAVDLILPEGGPRIAAVPITPGGVDTDPVPAGEQAAEPGEFPVPPESQDATGLFLNDADVVAETTSKQRRTRDRRGKRVVTLAADVLFDFDKATLGADGEAALGDVGTQIDDNAADGPIAIDGYTDSKGSEAYNLKLSRDRAETVRGVLADAVPDRTLRATGHGEADPVAPNTKSGRDNPAGRRKNRRVTVGYTLNRATAEPAPEPTPAPTSDPAQTQEAQRWSYTGPGPGDVSDFSVVAQGVRRVGNLSVLELEVTCEQSEADDCDQQNALTDVTGNNDASGVTLTDTAQDATYAPARAGTRDEVLGSVIRFVPGAKRQLAIYFAAVPSTTTSMTVQLPNGGPRIAGVPVS